MRRVETYVGQQVYEWLFSSQAQHTMTAIAKLCAAMLGTSVTVNGLGCTPTTPASMTVQIAPGELYQLESLEATTCGTLPADTTHQILKQGIRLDTFTTGTFAAPVTSGQSINYLIEAQYQDSDLSLDPTTGNSPVVLQFYNSANPTSPWSGPNNSGSTSNTFRDGAIAYQIKAGVAATTGTQVTPTPDAGWTGLWVVTVPFGASSLTATNISQYAGAPILPNGILQSILTGNLTYGIDNGTAGAVQATFPIPVTSLVDGMDVWVKIKNANPGATTFTPNPGVISPAPVVGGAHAALQGGELAANGRANFVWRQDISSWVLMECSGGALQIPPATQSQHAVQMAQAAGVVGSVRNLVMSVTAASATATLTADEIIVETALGGVRYCLPSFSKTINLATTGAGGMDTGSAPVSGWVAIYAIYNPTTATAALLATNATSAAQPNVYGGANMPSGYTASALVSVWNTNASGQFVVARQLDRKVSYAPRAEVAISASTSGIQQSGAINDMPKNARYVDGAMTFAATGAGQISMVVDDDAAGDGAQQFLMQVGSTGNYGIPFRGLKISATQTFFYQFTLATATGTGTWSLTGYMF
ncbi:hypothetical protein [Paraburkholderia caribensis]|uniref:hypothetical protein n=1 Tax=Paraburkholderia caribensis TaxID=75105 RepID=UPI0028594D0E|nr:hypothetical protein [Paraburkholderia caribensis]MDR6381842.1 hypothetical protein [Paraburkholderia caribensis]